MMDKKFLSIWIKDSISSISQIMFLELYACSNTNYLPRWLSPGNMHPCSVMGTLRNFSALSMIPRVSLGQDLNRSWITYRYSRTAVWSACAPVQVNDRAHLLDFTGLQRWHWWSGHPLCLAVPPGQQSLPGCSFFLSLPECWNRIWITDRHCSCVSELGHTFFPQQITLPMFSRLLK